MNAMMMIQAERERQIVYRRVEQQDDMSILAAAIAMATSAAVDLVESGSEQRTQELVSRARVATQDDPQRTLVIAAALLAEEIERLERAKCQK